LYDAVTITIIITTTLNCYKTFWRKPPYNTSVRFVFEVLSLKFPARYITTLCSCAAVWQITWLLSKYYIGIMYTHIIIFFICMFVYFYEMQYDVSPQSWFLFSNWGRKWVSRAHANCRRVRILFTDKTSNLNSCFETRPP